MCILEAITHMVHLTVEAVAWPRLNINAKARRSMMSYLKMVSTIDPGKIYIFLFSKGM